MRTLLPFAAFFASGASSLIFQAIWTRMLHHVFGATSVAMSTVLSAFMGGLGLGAYWFGKRASRFRKPLAVYAVCELGVAASALLLPWLLRADGFLADLNAWLRVSIGAGSLAFMLARFVCVVPLLIVPTTLMGGTLPLLAQHFVQNTDDADGTGARVGSLYAVNTLGAVFGTLIGNFVLLPMVGVKMTHAVAIGMNVGLAIAVLFFLSRSSQALPAQVEPRAPDQPQDSSLDTVFPRQVRRLAVITFGVSGACALAYEVVWSRALAMAIGSSMQSFALILVTFLVGIALGSAYVSALLAKDANVESSLWPNLFVSLALSALALLPHAVLTSVSGAVVFWLFCTLLAAVIALSARQRARADASLDADPRGPVKRGSLLLLVVPCAVALIECVRFATMRSKLPAVALHGYLPFVAAAVVCTIALTAMLVITLRSELPLLSGAIQLSIAVATFVSYLVQDEIPYVFARLVSALEDLPDHVTLVRFFMFVTAGLCTLPATLGMGAMFPVTLRLFTAGGREVGKEVAIVYSANTLGSICGAWLPGFVLMPLLGMETTLHAGMLLNLALALAMMWLAARTQTSRSSVDEDLELTRSSAPRLAPLLGITALATAVSIIVFAMPVRAPLRWDLSHMTLGAFRVSLARDVLDPTSWGEPDLVYYRDGVSTTVSVERWGRHLSLKNNGKVDASNGDDMATQIMVSAYPLLLHPKHGKDLDVAIVGFGSGVTVGAALQFPVRHIDAMELEEGVVEAASLFYSDVNHFKRTQETFPYVSAKNLSLFNDDGRNFLASTNKSYDVIISEPSNPWITGVSDLFTTEHFRVSKKRLKPGGLYCQWVQLYEMSPANVKTIYRTFASEFAYVVAFAAEELSSDTVLIGSDSPIKLDVNALRAAMAPKSVADELKRAYVASPHDVLARVLFAEKSEILAFTQLEERLRDGAFREELHALGDSPCKAPVCRRTNATLNTDDNMWIELRAPADLIGFARYQGYLRSFYGPKFPYGRLLSRVTGLDSDLDRAELALSLLAHGRKSRALEIVHTIASRADPRVDAAARTVELFADYAREPTMDVAVALYAPQLDARERSELARVERLIAEHIAARDYEKAHRLIDALDPLFIDRGPAQVHALVGYLNYKAAAGNRDKLRSATSELEAALRVDDAYARAHPELLFFLARAHDALASFHKATDTMSLFVARSSAH